MTPSQCDGRDTNDVRDTRIPTDEPTGGRARMPMRVADAGPHRLDQILNLLQGTSNASLADPGITLLPGPQLDTLFLLAHRQAEHCQDGLQLLLELWQDVLDHGGPQQAGTAHRVARQLLHHFNDHQRWQSLADNAAYYRDHALVALRIAEGLRSRA